MVCLSHLQPQPPLSSHPPLPPRAAGWGEEEREAKRAALRRVLDAAVGGNADDVFYYQGLHDIAAVLLFVCGELPAYRMLRALAACHLRDCTRPDLAAATETLKLLYPILEQVRYPAVPRGTIACPACAALHAAAAGARASAVVCMEHCP